MNILDLTNKNLIITELELADNFSALEKLGSILFNEGYVKKGFIKAVIEREKKFPTGIENGSVNIAIPHADAEYVLKPGLAIALLKNEVKFNRMDDPNKKINVKVLFMLAIKNPDEQLGSLKELMSIANNSNLMVSICSCKTSQQVLKILQKIILTDSCLNS